MRDMGVTMFVRQFAYMLFDLISLQWDEKNSFSFNSAMQYCWHLGIWMRHSKINRRHNEHDGVSYHLRLDWLFGQFFRRRSKKAPRHWPLWGEFTVDRWIPRRKGQQCGKCFLLMTSSWTTMVTKYVVVAQEATVFGLAFTEEPFLPSKTARGFNN